MTSTLTVLASVFGDVPVTARPRYVGVYLLIRRGEIVYVGQSTDIEARVAAHRVLPKKPTLRRRALRFDRALWFALHDHDLGLYEGALIRALRPRFNRGAPAHTGLDNEVLRRFGLPEHADEAANALNFTAATMAMRTPPAERRRQLAFARQVREERQRAEQRARARRLWAAVDRMFAEAHAS